MKKRLLLLSNSTNYGEEYLFYPRQEIQNFLGDSIKRILFIPFAKATGIDEDTSDYDQYSQKVGKVFKDLGYELDAIHVTENPQELIRQATAIVVGGGNTFCLFHWLHKKGLVEIIREKVNNGTPYLGWSAGSNLACPTLKTTNDMPIIDPINFQGLNLIPFQINPHYTDEIIPNHQGETRAERLQEFLLVNPQTYVVGLKEGTMLKIEGSSMKMIGDKTLHLFKYGEPIVEYDAAANLDFLVSV
ncbi:MAG: dipeptidase PepE [Symploca sp. SIO2E9]|nr:dipeptidase PepE [Symploca sp. SIO2E9]